MKFAAALHLILLLSFGSFSGVRAAPACPVTLTPDQVFSFGTSSPIWSSDFKTPFVAYLFLSAYANQFNLGMTNIYEGSCASTNFHDMINGRASKGSQSISSIQTKGGTPDYRFRSRGNLTFGDAQDIEANLGCGGYFRFRDVISFNTTQTNRIRLELRVRMDGNTSITRAIPGGAEQPAQRDLRINVQDLTACSHVGGNNLMNVLDQSMQQGPDYDSTNVLSVCPTSLLRLDIKVDLVASVWRFFTDGTVSSLGGLCYADYIQCVDGNMVCFEDCPDVSPDKCSGFSLRIRVLEDAAPDGANKKAVPARQGSVQIISAGGFDYGTPAPEFKPSLLISKTVVEEQALALVEWPAAASEWAIMRSDDFGNWSTITNGPSVDFERMMNQVVWPLTNSHQFFRLQKP